MHPSEKERMSCICTFHLETFETLVTPGMTKTEDWLSLRLTRLTWWHIHVLSFLLAEDCAPDGKCITLENSSADKDVDVSNWVLRRRVEGSPEISYTIPFGLVMKHGNELKIYARTAQNAHHRPPLQVVNDKLDSWGMGTECETKLFNEQGEEKASHSQKIVFGSESSRAQP